MEDGRVGEPIGAFRRKRLFVAECAEAVVQSLQVAIELFGVTRGKTGGGQLGAGSRYSGGQREQKKRGERTDPDGREHCQAPGVP